ncbi:BTB/POZ domain-containing protein NPY2 [Camellia lanceoleosa]|uniref:BTB/POZ domain-containing protein NPY2 n=1 Tax=Camellia lanceoleosa TaxID=1840588 RepID=A0ACC0HV53_9ERIC|nr:BTB/POZ domain-containing protein NPY2 [Camellia lanceoleosa]
MQNERLPLRVSVQILFFEQVRATSSYGGFSTPDLARSIKALLSDGSNGSSRSATTDTEEDCDAVPIAEELKALKAKLATLKLRDGGDTTKMNAEKVATNKVKGLLASKVFSKLWSNRKRQSEISSSETSDSPASTNVEETKSTSSRSRRHSLS